MPQKHFGARSWNQTGLWLCSTTRPREAQYPGTSVVQSAQRLLGTCLLIGLTLLASTACAVGREPTELPQPEATAPVAAPQPAARDSIEPPPQEVGVPGEQPQPERKAPAAPSPRVIPAAPAAPAPDPDGWRRIEGGGPYTVALPRELISRAARPRGIDAQLVMIETPSLEIRFFYGRQLGSGPPTEPGMSDLVQDSVVIDGEPGIIARYRLVRAPDSRPEYRARLFVVPPDPTNDHPIFTRKLVVLALCRSTEQCALAERIMRTIRFTRE